MICAALPMLVAAAWMWRQPVMADETDFITAAAHWPGLARLIPHPPGYVELIRSMFALAGESVGSARVIGVLSGLLSLWLIPVLARQMIEDPSRAERVWRWALLLFVASPLVLQNTMLLDIDNTVGIPVVLGALLVWWRSARWPLQWRVLAVGSMLAVAAWFKLPPPILLTGTIAGDAAWRRRPRDLLAIVLAAALGSVLFALAFELHRRATGFGYAEMEGTFRKVAWLGDVKTMVLRLPQTAGILLLWFSPGLAILWAAGAFARRDSESPDHRVRRELAVVFTLVALGFYAVGLPPAWGYPKYQAIVLPLIAIVAADAFENAVMKLPRGSLPSLAAVAAASLIAQQVWIGDPLLNAYRSTFETSMRQFGPRLMAGAAAITAGAAYVPLATLLALGVARLRGWPGTATIMSFLGASLLGVLAGVSLTQVRASYSTRYHYGTSYADLAQASRRLAAIANDSSFVLAPKEVLFYSRVPGEVVYHYVWETADPDSLLALAGKRSIDAMVWTTREENRAGHVLGDPRVRAMLEKGYVAESAGQYVLWTPRNRSATR